jgi:hypothetical protein
MSATRAAVGSIMVMTRAPCAKMNAPDPKSMSPVPWLCVFASLKGKREKSTARIAAHVPSNTLLLNAVTADDTSAASTLRRGRRAPLPRRREARQRTVPQEAVHSTSTQCSGTRTACVNGHARDSGARGWRHGVAQRRTHCERRKAQEEDV